MNLKQIKGVVSEQLVITDLLKKGFFVFTPIHRQCPVDIIAISPKGKMHLEIKLKVNLVYVTKEEIIYGGLRSATL